MKSKALSNLISTVESAGADDITVSLLVDSIENNLHDLYSELEKVLNEKAMEDNNLPSNLSPLAKQLYSIDALLQYILEHLNL